MQPDITEPKTTSHSPRSESGGAIPYQCCRNCFKNGISAHLKPFQINFVESVHACTRHECHFPLMEDNIESYITCQAPDKCLSSSPNSSMYSPAQGDPKSLQIQQGTVLTDENLLALQKQQAECDEILAASLSLSSYLTVNNLPTSKGSASNLCCDNILNVTQPLKSDPDDKTADCVSLSTTDSINVGNGSVTLHEKSKKVSAFANLSRRDDLSKKHSDVDKSLGMTATQNVKENISCNPNHNKRNLLELPPPKRQSIMLQWQNESNLCWLDVLLHCIVNSNLIRMAINCNRKVDNNNSDLFYRLCSTFDEIQAAYENLTSKYGDLDKIPIYETLFLRCKLSQARISVLKLLETSEHMKGTPESAMELFPTIIKLDSALKDLFSVDVRWEFCCGKCGHKQHRRATTPLVSFPSTTPYFHPLNATFLRSCFKCQAKDEPMTMVMEKIPPCLMMHFLCGLPHNQVQVMDFGLQGLLYSVCALIQYITKPCNHFVVWIRDTKSNKWLRCDGLKDSSCTWRLGTPKIPAEEIHMLMWEKQVSVSTLTPADGAPDDRKQHLQNIINEAVVISNEDDSEIFVDPDETIDLTDQASDEDAECNEIDASATVQSPFEDRCTKSSSYQDDEDVGLSNVFDELNNKESNSFSMSGLLKNQLKEHIASAGSTEKPSDECITHWTDNSSGSFHSLNSGEISNSPISIHTSCSDTEGLMASNSTGLDRLRKKRKRHLLRSSSSSDNDEAPSKMKRTEESSPRRLDDYFHAPSSLLKSILSPVVAMTDCMKTMSESLRKRFYSMSDNNDDSSSSSNNSFEQEDSHNSPDSGDPSACLPSRHSGDASQDSNTSMNLQDEQVSSCDGEQVEAVADNFSDSSVSSTSPDANQAQTEPSTDLSESYINILKFKKKSATAVEPYRFTGKANYFGQNIANHGREFSSDESVQSACSDCNVSEYICIAPQLGTEENFTKHSTLPLKEVNSQLDLGSNSSMLLTHHYDKRQPLKSLLIVDPLPTKRSVNETLEKEVPTQPDEKGTFSKAESQEDSSEDDYEDDIDEWKPSWEKKRQKEANERLERQARFIKPPSTRTVTFLNLQMKPKPVKPKLLVSSGVFKSYKPKGTITHHRASNIHPAVLGSEHQHCEKPCDHGETKSQLNTFFNETTLSKQNTSGTLKKKNNSSESTSDAVNLLHQDWDSGYGGNGSRCSSVTGDHHNDLSENMLNRSTNTSRDLHTTNHVQPAPTVSCPRSIPDLSTRTHSSSTSTDLEDFLDSLPLDMNLSINPIPPGNLASSGAQAEELAPDIFDFSEDLFSFLNL